MKVALNTRFIRFKEFFKPGKSSVGALSPDVLRYLSRDNPTLLDLKRRYTEAKLLPHSFWSPWENTVNLQTFRGENDYLSQTFLKETERRYALTCAYVEMTDTLGLLPLLQEDTLFGVKTWEFIPGKPVSRDLMDSILEMTFLQKGHGFSRTDSLRVLDIGAGYGRFAHRLTSAFPQTQVTCIDPVATSTFLSDFYLKFRGCKRASVLPFDHLSEIQPKTFDVAANIHSWSECTHEFIVWWLDRLCEWKIPYLFHVPHTRELISLESDNSHKPYLQELEKRGFKLVLKQSKFHRSKVVEQSGLFPTDYLLFKRDV
jgi:hypothetical protein